jgi:hypothetical protein
MDAAVRELVRERAGNRCEYCRLRQDHTPFVLQIEHIIARKHGGGDELSNLALACDRCNLHKGSDLTAIDPETKQNSSIREASPGRSTLLGGWTRHGPPPPNERRPPSSRSLRASETR